MWVRVSGELHGSMRSMRLGATVGAKHSSGETMQLMPKDRKGGRDEKHSEKIRIMPKANNNYSLNKERRV